MGSLLFGTMLVTTTLCPITASLAQQETKRLGPKKDTARTKPTAPEKKGPEITVRLTAEDTPVAGFVVKFPVAMVKGEEAGFEADSPIVFTPELAGTWQWKTRSEGEFTPSEPTKLGTEYTITLSPSAKAPGKASLPELNFKYSTPVFRAFREKKVDPEKLPQLTVSPAVEVIFNDEVSSSKISDYVVFQSNTGETIKAKVTPTLVYKYQAGYRRTYPALLPWAERFYVVKNRPRSKFFPTENSSSAPDYPLPNQMTITPATPLTPGIWTLVVKQDAPSDNGAKLPAATELVLGVLKPMQVNGAFATNDIEEGRRIIVQFNKSLKKDFPINDYVSVSPEPADFKMVRQDSSVILTGKFELRKDYAVKVKSGVTSDEDLKLASDNTQSVKIKPIEEALVLPFFSTMQNAAGTRKFVLKSINSPDFTVKARMLDRSNIIKTYSRYDTKYAGAGEARAPIEFNDIQGKPVFTKDISPKGEEDVYQETTFNWDDILSTAGTKTGAVYIMAQSKERGVQAMVQLTDIGLYWKDEGKELRVFAFSLSTGKPMSDVKISTATHTNKFLKTATTNQDGWAVMPMPQPSDKPGAANTDSTTTSTTTTDEPEPSFWLLAEKGTDICAAEMGDANEVARWRFELPIYWEDEAATTGAKLKGFLFTERPVYRPGNTVYLKGIFRRENGDEITIPKGEKLNVTVADSDSNTVFEQEVKLSEFGSFDFSFVLPEGKVSNFTITAAVGEESFTHDIQSLEFEPVAFETKLTIPNSVPKPGHYSFPIHGNYLMGRPLDGAKVKYSWNGNDTSFAPEGYDPYVFIGYSRGRDDEDTKDNQGYGGSDGEAALDNKGNLDIELDLTTNKAFPSPRLASVTAEVTDVNQQTVSTTKELTIHSSQFYLGVASLNRVFRAGQPVPIKAVAVKTDGTVWAKPLESKVTLRRVDYNPVRKEGAGNASTYETERTVTDISTQDATLPAPKDDGRDVETAPTLITLTPEKSGLHYIDIETKDDEGNRVFTRTGFYVYGEDTMAWDYKDVAKLDLIADKKSYKPGDTAVLLAKAPFSGTAIVTVERHKVLRTFSVPVDSNAASIAVPLNDADGPNAFVSVLLIRGSNECPREFKATDHRVGYIQLSVEKESAKLNIAVESTSKVYSPGQDVTLGATVTDSKGKPVKNAEVTLYAVDEGILKLTNAENPNPFGTFYEPISLAIRSALTLQSLFSDDPRTQSFSNKGYVIGGGGDEYGPLRNNFPPCAYWNAKLVTDANGKVTANCKAPDGLTRYRIVAVAATTTSQFGTGESSFEIKKKLMVQPGLPRFANVGDKIIARAVVLNESGQAGKADVILELDNTATASQGTQLKQTVDLAAGETKTVDFTIDVTATGTAKWQFKAGLTTASGSREVDSVQSTLDVGYPLPKRSNVVSRRLGQGQVNLFAGVEQELLKANGTANVLVSTSRITEAGEAVNQLLHYPYGCVEQTSSCLMPWLMFENIQSALPQVRRTPKEIERAINGGISRILSMQKDNGGLGYWPTSSEPLYWGSAYGGMALAIAKTKNATVPEEPLKKLVDYLQKQLRGRLDNPGKDDFEADCMALYALALLEKPEPAYVEKLFKLRDRLSRENRALLALAILTGSGDPDMARTLLTTDSADQPAPAWFYTPARETSIQMLAWMILDPSGKQPAELEDKLLRMREGGQWGTTQGNVWALIAMAERAKTANPGIAIEPTLTFNKGETDALDLNESSMAAQRTYPLVTNSKAPEMAFKNPSPAELVVQVRVEAWPAQTTSAAVDKGYAITRTYEKVNNNGTLEAITDTNLTAGDLVLVTLSVGVKEQVSYIAIDDPLPAILEAQQETFDTAQTSAKVSLKTELGSSYKEIRDERVLFFDDLLRPGTYTVQYLARVRAAGTVTAPCAKVEEMYNPKKYGFSSTQTLTAAPLKK